MRLGSLAFGLALTGAVNALSQGEPHPRPTWRDVMAKGIVPYHKLTVDDFPINNKVHPEHNFYIESAIFPQYHFIIKPHQGFAYAAVDEWMVFSGLNKKGTSRKSRFKAMKEGLPYAQAVFDINEIHALQIAALKTGEIPSARGNSFEEAQTLLNAKLKEFLAAKYKETEAATEAFAKATGHGANKKKLRELAAEIRKRLEVTPNTTVPFTEEAASPGSSPSAPVSAPNVSPAASATPLPSPSATRPKL